MDFREPRFRREVFLRFYEFHLRYKAHPGCIYYVMPYLAKVNAWSLEQRLWFAFINGNTQNPVTSWLIFREFPMLENVDPAKLAAWFETQYKRLAFDTDRRYFKKRFVDSVKNYLRLLKGRSQADFFAAPEGSPPQANFLRLWERVNKSFVFFGRLSVYSYLEYLRVMGLAIECNQLFLHDMAGSRSHRNGLCKVLGRDDLDWHESNPGFDGRYDATMLAWLTDEADQLLDVARERFKKQSFARDVGFFTLESALCTYKSWHRPNRRYPNVYNDMFAGRIREAEDTFDERLDVFWEARRASLPAALRLEDNPADCGVKPEKQNHYLQTGEVVMMDLEWPCFRNAFNDGVREKQEKRS
jgi:hypothetical protein